MFHFRICHLKLSLAHIHHISYNLCCRFDLIHNNTVKYNYSRNIAKMFYIHWLDSLKTRLNFSDTIRWWSSHNFMYRYNFPNDCKFVRYFMYFINSMASYFRMHAKTCGYINALNEDIVRE